MPGVADKFGLRLQTPDADRRQEEIDRRQEEKGTTEDEMVS